MKNIKKTTKSQTAIFLLITLLAITSFSLVFYSQMKEVKVSEKNYSVLKIGDVDNKKVEKEKRVSGQSEKSETEKEVGDLGWHKFKREKFGVELKYQPYWEDAAISGMGFEGYALKVLNAGMIEGYYTRESLVIQIMDYGTMQKLKNEQFGMTNKGDVTSNGRRYQFKTRVKKKYELVIEVNLSSEKKSEKVMKEILETLIIK